MPREQSQMPYEPQDHAEGTPSEQLLLHAITRSANARRALSASERALLGLILENSGSVEDFARAAALVQENRTAAEYVAERKLLSAAEASGPVPPALSSELRKRFNSSSTTQQLSNRLADLAATIWPARASVAAAAVIVSTMLLAVWVYHTGLFHPDLQFVISDSGDSLLIERSSASSDTGTREFTVPTNVFEKAVEATARSEHVPEQKELAKYLQGEASQAPAKVVIDREVVQVAKQPALRQSPEVKLRVKTKRIDFVRHEARVTKVQPAGF